LVRPFVSGMASQELIGNENRSGSLLEEAFHYTDAIQNPEAKAFVEYGVATVITGRRICASESPMMPLDLKYMCHVFESMYANKGALELILHGKGDELRFWP